ncbi:MAG TPA: PAS domain S-box protein [Bryobacteraceae bacterium]|nr:PAS domain S-box protein [Bryobacteraceae bacterium]
MKPEPSPQPDSDLADALRFSESQLPVIFESIGIGVAVVDTTGRFLHCNPAFAALVGYSLDELRRMRFTDLTHPEDIAAELEIFRRATTVDGAESGATLTKRYIRKDGRIVWARLVAQVARDAVGRAQYGFGIVIDITAQKEAEDQLRKLSVAVEQSPASIVITNTAADIEYVNPKFTELTGYTPSEVLGRNPRLLQSGETPPAVHRELWNTLRAGREWRGEFRNKKKNGELFWENASISPIKTASGAVTHYLAVKEDITERKRMEEEISRQLRMNESIAEMSAHLLSLASHEEISSSILRHAQLHTDSPHGFVGYVNPRDRTFVAPTLSGDVWADCRIEDRSVIFGRFGGLWGWVLKNKLPVLTNDVPSDARSTGVPAGHLPIRRFLAVPCVLGDEAVGEIAVANSGRDYTDDDLDLLKRLAAVYTMAIERQRTEEERTRIQEQLRQSQKLEAVGQLAGGVAHDFNNLLTVINGFTELAMSRLNPLDPLSQELEEIRKAGDRAASLTQQLLAFSRRQLLKPKLIDLNAAVADVEKMLRRLIGEHIELTTVLDPNLGKIKADPGQIQQVIVNLAVNARDAMPGGGRLTVATKNVELHSHHLLEDPLVQPGPYVMVSVADTGTGMSKKILEHIFEPFFTTKEQGKGTGLGLPTVYGIVKQSGGSIRVDSQPGLGATFSVYLPRAEDAADEHQGVKLGGESPGGSETVLLVEDEQDVRELAARILESCGYKVLVASNGDEALTAAAQYPGVIDLMVTDLVMPGMDGRELAQRITAVRPQTKVLLISGYTDAPESRRLPFPPDSAFLQKPFTRSDLASKVRELLDRAQNSATVLVVDDEAEIRRLLRRILEAAGYDVFEAGNGRAAMEQLAHRSADLVITDIVMPECEGIEMIGSLHKERPEVKIIAVSGAFGGQFLHVAQAVGAHAVLQKPLRAERVLAVVRQLLG